MKDPSIRRDNSALPSFDDGSLDPELNSGEQNSGELVDCELVECEFATPAFSPLPPTNADFAEGQSIEQQSTANPPSFQGRRFQLVPANFLAVPAWLVSLFVHVVLIVVLAAISLDSVRESLAVLITASTSETDQTNSLEEFELVSDASIDFSQAESDSSFDSPAELELDIQPVETSVALEVQADANLVELADAGLAQQFAPSELLSAQLSNINKLVSARGADQRRELLKKYGGNGKSEEAVAKALKWLAMHQLPDGSWSFTHSIACRGQCGNAGDMTEARNGATALAILPFLGAGQTHLEGQYKQVVAGGLRYLATSMDQNVDLDEHEGYPGGSWNSRFSLTYGLYCHGLASIAMCEAYAMTKDPAIAEPAQKSLAYIAWSQNPNGGGWQYTPRQGGDVSVTGWQIMALKSGSIGNLAVPISTISKAQYFLDSVQMNDGALYGYNRPIPDLERARATTACGLLCRMYMGWPKEQPQLIEGVNFLAGRGPHPTDMYYNYYATQVMKQFGGKQWKKWNEKMRSQLVNSQVKEGHAAGSWFFAIDTPGTRASHGGRLYFTAMSAMTLEVYYRFLPLYDKQTDEDSFKL